MPKSAIIATIKIAPGRIEASMTQIREEAAGIITKISGIKCTPLE